MTTAGATRPMLERRRERRIAVHLPMSVRGTDLRGQMFEEQTSSVNICRGGAAFAVRNMIRLGSSVQINMPISAAREQGETEFSTSGRVVHIAPGSSSGNTIVGVQFTGPRFHHLFVSESTT